MTDWTQGSTLDALDAALNEPQSGRQCQKEIDGARCVNFLPEGAAPARRYCDEHYVGGNRNQAPKKEAPPKIVVDLGGAKKPQKGSIRARETAAGATAFMNVVATGLSVTGDQVCAAAVAGGAAQWGEAVGELSKYQPWLTQLFAPVGGEGQLGAWLGFLLATGAITLPVLAHHNLLPASVGAKLGGVMVAADDVAAASAPAA